MASSYPLRYNLILILQLYIIYDKTQANASFKRCNPFFIHLPDWLALHFAVAYCVSKKVIVFKHNC